MACAVYCLVPSDEELEPLVRRLRQAGVHKHDISVVQRPASAAMLYALPLVWTAMWWPMYLYALYACNAQRWLDGDRRAPEVIPLSLYLEKSP